MLRIAYALSAAAIAALLTRPPGPAAGEVLHLTTEQYAPCNFDQDGEIKGLGADQVREIMRRSGIAYDMELLPWSRAIGLDRERPMTCVFTTAHTVDRNAQFKWVEPLLVERTLLIRAAGSGDDPADLAAATAYRTGPQTGDDTVELPQNAGFTDIDLARHPHLPLTKLLSRRVHLPAAPDSFLPR